MKQTKLMVMAMMAVALMATSCASKKDLQNCQNENKELSSNYQATKEKLAHIAIVDDIAKTIPTAHVISSKGCPQRGDGLHFIAESYRTMGKRYANMMLALQGIIPDSNYPRATGTALAFS